MWALTETRHSWVHSLTVEAERVYWSRTHSQQPSDWTSRPAGHGQVENSSATKRRQAAWAQCSFCYRKRAATGGKWLWNCSNDDQVPETILIKKRRRIDALMLTSICGRSFWALWWSTRGQRSSINNSWGSSGACPAESMMCLRWGEKKDLRMRSWWAHTSHLLEKSGSRWENVF